MNENHAIQRDLGGSGEENERLISAALDAGCLGAKLAGAGQGGTIIALHEDVGYLSMRLRDAGASQILLPQAAEGLVVETCYQQ
jgi:mevalonate kinase